MAQANNALNYVQNLFAAHPEVLKQFLIDAGRDSSDAVATIFMDALGKIGHDRFENDTQCLVRLMYCTALDEAYHYKVETHTGPNRYRNLLELINTTNPFSGAWDWSYTVLKDLLQDIVEEHRAAPSSERRYTDDQIQKLSHFRELVYPHLFFAVKDELSHIAARTTLK